MLYRILISLAIVVGIITPYLIGWTILTLVKDIESRKDALFVYFIGFIIGGVLFLTGLGLFHWIEWILHG